MGTAGRTVLVSSEVLEEITEILLMLDASAVPYASIHIDAPESVVDRLPSSVTGDPRVVLHPYSVSTTPSVRNKLVGLLGFVWLMLRLRPDLLFSGFSMMKHRAVSWVLRIPHFAWIRGVTFDPDTSVGISDAVRNGRLGRLVPRRVIATYHADRVFTVGEVNRRFVVDRGMPVEAVDVVGPVWLNATGSTSSTSPVPTTYLVTAAWAAHGLHEAHDAQTEMLARAAARWNGGSRLAFRVHPRDYFPYDSDPRFEGVHLDRQLPGEILSVLGSNDIVVAPLSTLAFEALHVGAQVAFYADPAATSSYNHVYEWLGITPTSGSDLALSDLRPVRSLDVEVFSPVDLAPVRRALDALH